MQFSFYFSLLTFFSLTFFGIHLDLTQPNRCGELFVVFVEHILNV